MTTASRLWSIVSGWRPAVAGWTAGGERRSALTRRRGAWSVALLVVLGVLGAAAVWFWDPQTQFVGAQSPCANGTVVPSPAEHPALVADCEALLAAKDALRGSAALNWDASTALTDWTGIEVGTVAGVRRVTELNLDGAGIQWHDPAGPRSSQRPQPPAVGLA